MSGTRTVLTRELARLLGSFVLVSSVLLQGCASAGSDNPFTESQRVDGYLLRVESQNSYEVMVYVNPFGRRELIGTIPGSGLEFLEFEYPSGVPLNVELETRLGDRYRMQPFRVPGGGRLDLVIMGDLRRSAFVRRGPE